MRKDLNVDEVMRAMHLVKAGEMAPEVFVDTVSSILQHNLNLFKAPTTVQNAGQVANILSTYLFPGKALSQTVSKRIGSGWLPDFTLSEPEPHALERGVSVIALSMRQTLYEDVGVQLLDLLNAQGHLPNPNDVREY